MNLPGKFRKLRSCLWVAMRKASKLLKICFNVLLSYCGRRKSTYCPFLWEFATIDRYGKVFSCCRFAPWPLGNIYKNTLTEIWAKSWKLKIARWLSSRGALHCFARCFIRSLCDQKESARRCKGRPAHPKNIMLVCGEFCNHKCLMCNTDRDSKVCLDIEYAKKNIDWPKIEETTLTGGEVLAIDSAKELFLWLTREMNKKVDILSNGSLINPEWAERLARGGGCVTVSVNAASGETYKRVCQGEFLRTVENLKRLAELKRKLNSPSLIRFKFTVIPENAHEIAQAILLANELGCDEVIFGFATGGREFLAREEGLRRQLKTRIAQLMSDPKVHISIERNYLTQLNLL